MPLEQLYTKSPMEQYGGLSLGLRMGMGPEEFGQYETRQQEYNQQIDELNRRATEINPYIVEQQRLENQKNQYLMPTHQASGMKAQAEMGIPDFYRTQAQTTRDKSAVEGEIARGQFPTARETAATQARTTLDTSKLNQAWVAINNFDAEAPDAEQALQQLDPQLYQRLQPMIAKYGMGKTKEHLLNRVRSIALSDPKHIQAVDLEAHKPVTPRATNEWDILLGAAKGDPYAIKAWKMHAAQNPNASKAAVVQLAEAYAIAAGRKTPNAEDLDKANRVVQVVEQITKVEGMRYNPNTGKWDLVTETTKGGAQQPSDSTGGVAGTYVVRNMDTPKSIAEAHGITYAELIAANPGLTSKNFRVGNSLTIPKPGTGKPLTLPKDAVLK